MVLAIFLKLVYQFCVKYVKLIRRINNSQVLVKKCHFGQTFQLILKIHSHDLFVHGLFHLNLLLQITSKIHLSFSSVHIRIHKIYCKLPQIISRAHRFVYGTISNDLLLISELNWSTKIAACSLKISTKASKFLKWKAGCISFFLACQSAPFIVTILNPPQGIKTS